MPSSKVYMTSGGDNQVVGSSGYIDVESGGQIDVQSGGHIDLESGGYIAAASGGYISLASGGYVALASGAYLTMPAQTVSSTSTTLNNYGLSYVVTTSTGTHDEVLVMSAPVAGVEKFIGYGIGATTKTIDIDCTSDVVIEGYTTDTDARYIHWVKRANHASNIQLVALSATKWLCLSKTTNISLTTAT